MSECLSGAIVASNVQIMTSVKKTVPAVPELSCKAGNGRAKQRMEYSVGPSLSAIAAECGEVAVDEARSQREKLSQRRVAVTDLARVGLRSEDLDGPSRRDGHDDHLTDLAEVGRRET